MVHPVAPISAPRCIVNAAAVIYPRLSCVCVRRRARRAVSHHRCAMCLSRNGCVR